MLIISIVAFMVGLVSDFNYMCMGFGTLRQACINTQSRQVHHCSHT